MLRASRLVTRIALSVDGSGRPPIAFLLFVAGWNDTEKGRFLFDTVAAEAVMADFARRGVDLAIDLEHQMLGGVSSDPTSRDARGWFKLAVRPDGSLWAVDVTWTPDGAARLSEKRQRYVSPAFEFDTEDKRVMSIANVAITSMPATRNTPALVAASRGQGQGMDPNLVQKALDALETGDAKAALELLKGLLASALGADPDASTEDAPPPAGDGGVDEATESAAPADGADGADGAGAEDPKKKMEQKAASALLLRMTGTTSIIDMLSQVETYRASHLTLERERQILAVERATLESAERRKLVVELIALGAEFPATVWADDTAKTIKSRWLKMPIAELRAHTSEQRAARGGVRAPSPKPAVLPGATSVEVGGKVVELTADQARICAELKCDPKTFAALRASIR